MQCHTALLHPTQHTVQWMISRHTCATSARVHHGQLTLNGTGRKGDEKADCRRELQLQSFNTKLILSAVIVGGREYDQLWSRLSLVDGYTPFWVEEYANSILKPCSKCGGKTAWNFHLNLLRRVKSDVLRWHMHYHRYDYIWEWAWRLWG